MTEIERLILLFWDPSLMTFIGITVLPVYLLFTRKRLRSVDKGYRLIFGGGVVLSLMSFVDYLEDIPLIQARCDDFPWLITFIDMGLMDFTYAVGTASVAVGLSRWLPAVMQLTSEIEQRKFKETELRDLAEEYNNAAQLAEEANKAKSNFLANMSHELRTPLNAVIGYSQMLRQGVVPMTSDKAQEYLCHIENSGAHLLAILNDILDLSKTEAGKFDVSEGAFDLKSILESSVAFCRPLAMHKDLPVELKCPAIMVISDRRIVKQIMINLISNAIKFTDKGHVRIKVEKLPADHDGQGQIIIDVIDTGIGMDEFEIKQALEPFHQLENNFNRSREGTGLGLPLVMRQSQLIGAAVDIQSAPGKGTKVRVTLPLSCNGKAA